MTTLTALQQLSRANRDMEINARAFEFAKLAQYVLSHKGKFSDAALAAARSSRDGNLGPALADIVKGGAGGGIGREHFKAATTAGTLVGQPLADYSAISQGFINSLVNAGAFDALLASMVPVPFSTGTVGAVSIGATAFSVSEGSVKPISRLTIQNQLMNPIKAHVIVPFTQEVARSAFIGATQLIQRQLQRAVALGTDQALVTAITSGVTPIPSSGSTGESIRADIAGMLGAVGTGQDSKLFLLVPALVCKMWSMATNAKGLSAFPGLGPLGGEIQKIPVRVTDGAGATSGLAILVDASGIAAAPGEVELQEFREASIQSDTAPDSPASASTSYESLWQTNKVAIVAERFFCAVRVRPDAVASVFNLNSWQAGNSPP